MCQAALEQDVTLGESRLMTGRLDQSQRRCPRPLSPPSLGHGAVARAARCVAEPRCVKGHRDEQASGTRPEDGSLVEDTGTLKVLWVPGQKSQVDRGTSGPGARGGRAFRARVAGITTF